MRLGATPLTGSGDVLEALGIERAEGREQPEVSDAAQQVLAVVRDAPAGADELVAKASLDAGAVSVALTELELAGLVSAEIEALLAGSPVPGLVSTDDSVEDPVAFAMEKHLEDFLVENWSQTELWRDHDIFEEDGERVGQQYPTDTGPIDILAISRNKARLLVVELKRGRESDVVVGQVLRYVGYVQDELAEEGQTVQGAIIALKDDLRLRRALAVVPSKRNPFATKFSGTEASTTALSGNVGARKLHNQGLNGTERFQAVRTLPHFKTGAVVQPTAR